MTLLAAGLTLLADTNIDPSTGHPPEWGKAAPVALLIIVLLGVALFILIKSMNRQLKKVPPAFGDATDAGSTATDAAAHTEPASESDGPGAAGSPR